MDALCQVVAHAKSGPLHRVIRLKNQEISKQARAGNALEFEGCRLPIMRANPSAGWLECLYLCSNHPCLKLCDSGEQIAVTLVQEQAFRPPTTTHNALLIGEELGLAPILFLSLTLPQHLPMVLLGSHSHFPFRPHPSRLLLPHLPCHLIATMPLLEERKIACRLAHSQDAPGCFEGSVVTLATEWLANYREREEEAITVYACGEHPRLAEKVAGLTDSFGLPHQCITLSGS